MKVIKPAKAATTVFSTYEILENILSNLSMKDLINAQQVSKEWHSLTARSKVLRQNLYLAAKLTKDLESLGTSPLLCAEDAAPERELEIVEPHPFFEFPFNPPSDRPWVYELTGVHAERLLSWHEDGQWKDMFVIQSPTEEVYVTLYFGARWKVGPKLVKAVGGVRLGRVVERLHRMFWSAKKLRLNLDRDSALAIDQDIWIDVEGPGRAMEQ